MGYLQSKYVAYNKTAVEALEQIERFLEKFEKLKEKYNNYKKVDIEIEPYKNNYKKNGWKITLTVYRQDY